MELFWLRQVAREKLWKMGVIPSSQKILHECEPGKDDQLSIEAVMSKHSQYVSFLEACFNSPNFASYDLPGGLKKKENAQTTLYFSDLAYNEWGLLGNPDDVEREAALHVAESLINLHLSSYSIKVYETEIESYSTNLASRIYFEIARLIKKGHIGICERAACQNIFISNSKKTKSCSSSCRTAKSNEKRAAQLANPTQQGVLDKASHDQEGR